MSISSIAASGAAGIAQQLQAQAQTHVQTQAQAQVQAGPTQQTGKPHHHHGGVAPASGSGTAQPSVFTAPSILDTLA